MKTTLAIFFASALSVLSAGWDTRVDYFKQYHVNSKFYAISENAGVYTVSHWDASLGVKPTIAELTANDAVVDAWYSDYQISIRRTPEWASFTNSLVAYSPAMDNVTNSISKVTDAQSKASDNDLKNAIKVLQDEIKALRVLIGKNMQVES